MIAIPVQYAYLSLSLATLAVWGALFYWNKEGRQRQLIFSLLFCGVGPVGELFYIPDYWHPVTVWSVAILRSYISIEDFVFSFAIMGIMTSLPNLLVHVANTRVPGSLSWATIAKMAGALTLVAALSLVLWLNGVNSIFATSLAMLLTAGAILTYFRQQILFRIAVVGALSMLSVMFIIYWLAFLLISDSDAILQATWSLYGTPLGLRLLRVPLLELVWAFSFGAFFSVLFIKDRIRTSP